MEIVFNGKSQIEVDANLSKAKVLAMLTRLKIEIINGYQDPNKHNNKDMVDWLRNVQTPRAVVTLLEKLIAYYRSGSGSNTDNKNNDNQTDRESAMPNKEKNEEEKEAKETNAKSDSKKSNKNPYANKSIDEKYYHDPFFKIYKDYLNKKEPL